MRDVKNVSVYLSSTARHFRPIQYQGRSCMHPHQDTSCIVLYWQFVMIYTQNSKSLFIPTIMALNYRPILAPNKNGSMSQSKLYTYAMYVSYVLLYRFSQCKTTVFYMYTFVSHTVSLLLNKQFYRMIS